MYKGGGADYPYILNTKRDDDFVHGDFVYFDSESDFKNAVRATDRIEGFKPYNGRSTPYSGAVGSGANLYERIVREVCVMDNARENIISKTTA